MSEQSVARQVHDKLKGYDWARLEKDLRSGDFVFVPEEEAHYPPEEFVDKSKYHPTTF